MYVSYETYAASAFASDGVAQERYPALASLADAIIDSWTYDRVGLAISDGEELPQAVVNLYAAIVSNAPSMVEGASSAASAEVSSFSNGVDTYSFEVDGENSISERLYSSLEWLIDALPVRWTAACIYPVGRCHCRKYGHAC